MLCVQRMNGTGSQTAYIIDRNVGNVQDVLISVDGVVQDCGNLFNYRGNKSFWSNVHHQEQETYL